MIPVQNIKAQRVDESINKHTQTERGLLAAMEKKRACFLMTVGWQAE